MNIAELEERFAIPGALAFEQTASGLIFARITTPAAATIFLQGAHLTHWQPAGQAPVIFLSARSDMDAGKPIRGGVPVIFPWFGARHDGGSGPSHGFARTSDWELAFAALSGDEMHLTFTLAPNAASCALGFDHFRLAYRIILGRTLTLELTVANAGFVEPGATDSADPLVFEEALHTYYAVADVRHATLSGLEGTAFLDKTDEMRAKVQPQGSLTFTGTTDRVYLDTVATCVIDDVAGNRRIVLEKSGSNTTVVWNPWTELAAKLQDMEPEGWRGMLCVETANVGEGSITLAPGETHTMRAIISIEPRG